MTWPDEEADGFAPVTPAAPAPGPQATARTYVTEIWYPPAGNGVLHALHSCMKEPEPLPEPELETGL